jgi:hypothetical protein
MMAKSEDALLKLERMEPSKVRKGDQYDTWRGHHGGFNAALEAEVGFVGQEGCVLAEFVVPLADALEGELRVWEGQAEEAICGCVE